MIGDLASTNYVAAMSLSGKDRLRAMVSDIERVGSVILLSQVLFATVNISST